MDRIGTRKSDRIAKVWSKMNQPKRGELLDRADQELAAAEEAHPTIVKLTDEGNKFATARAVPGSYYDKPTRSYVLNVNDATPRAALVACKLFPQAAVEAPELEALRDRLAQDVRPFDNATPYNEPIEAPRVRAKLAERGHDLFDYQAIDCGYLAAVLREHGAAYLGWERGLGKTIGAMSLMDELDCRKVLVVAPNTAKGTVWEPDLKEFFEGSLFTHVEVLPNSKARREKVLGWVQEWTKTGQSHALIVNYEQLRLIGTTKQQWQKYGEWDMVVLDESHRIKSTDAKMSRAAKKVPAKYRLELSGSIISNHVEELFSQLQFLFPDAYKSKWRDWNDRFVDYVEGGFSKIAVGVKLNRLKELRNELGVFMTYRRKEDELDLPDRTEQWLEVDLSPAQRKAYNELQDDCITKLDNDDIVVAQVGLVMLQKLRQIATGLSLVSDELTDSTKIDLATDLIKDNEDEAFVVFSWYKAAARQMQAALAKAGIDSYLIDGDVKEEDRREFISEFQAGSGTRVLIGTISTMGESVNLFRANNAIFLDRSWNPSDNTQAADRIYRIGQDKPVTITHIVARDTVDQTNVTPSLNSKEALRALILGANK